MAGSAVVDSQGSEPGKAVLAFEIKTLVLPEAEFVANFVLRTARAYRAFVKRRYGRRVDTHLVLTRLEVGSVVGEFIAISQALDTLFDHRATLAGFVTHLQDAVQLLMASQPAEVPNETKKLLQSTSDAVTKEIASDFLFNNTGTINGPVIIVNGDNAKDIARGLLASHSEKPTADAPPALTRAETTGALGAPAEPLPKWAEPLALKTSTGTAVAFESLFRVTEVSSRRIKLMAVGSARFWASRLSWSRSTLGRMRSLMSYVRAGDTAGAVRSSAASGRSPSGSC